MARLPETAKAIYGLRANLEEDFGMHTGHNVVTGVPGTYVGEERFDPAHHPASAIDLLSTTELATDSPIPYVPMVLPHKTLSMNILIHDDSGNVDVPKWLEPAIDYRRDVAKDIIDSVEASKQMGDETNLYVLGNPRRPRLYGRAGHIIPNTQSPEASAEAIANIAQTGLSLIVGNFSRLPLYKPTGIGFKHSVGIKANHPLELEFQPNTGIWPLGGTKEVNTNSSKDLRRTNKNLLKEHAEIASRLGKVGLAHVQILTNEGVVSGLSGRGVVDRQLATILRKMASR